MPFAIRGVIWYQGESDSGWPELYESLMGDLIASWRSLWGYDFPFLFVQLAPFKDRTDEDWAWVRDAQLKCLQSVPDSGMVVITDGGEKEDIDPQAKQLSGERLAVLAASLDNRKVNADLPTFKKIKIKDATVRIKFKDTSGGLETRRVALNTIRGHLPGKGSLAALVDANELKGFSLCGADKQFVPAVAKIVSRNAVEVSSPDVAEPVAVRYGWVNFPLCNLYGGNGMPPAPFRTDDFPMPNLSGEKRGKPFTSIQAEWGRPMEALNQGDGVFQSLDIEGAAAMKADGLYLYFRAPDLNKPASAKIQAIYFDKGFASIQLRYDSASDPWTLAGEVRCKNSNRWNVVSFDLPDAAFAKRCNGGDIRLQSSASLIVGGVFVVETK